MKVPRNLQNWSQKRRRTQQQIDQCIWYRWVYSLHHKTSKGLPPQCTSNSSHRRVGTRSRKSSTLLSQKAAPASTRSHRTHKLRYRHTLHNGLCKANILHFPSSIHRNKKNILLHHNWHSDLHIPRIRLSDRSVWCQAGRIRSWGYMMCLGYSNLLPIRTSGHIHHKFRLRRITRKGKYTPSST